MLCRQWEKIDSEIESQGRSDRVLAAALVFEQSEVRSCDGSTTGRLPESLGPGPTSMGDDVDLL